MIRSPEKYRTEGGGGERNDQILLLNYLYTIGNQSPMVISIRLFPDVSHTTRVRHRRCRPPVRHPGPALPRFLHTLLLLHSSDVG